MNALEIRNLTKSYPGFTLDNINLTLPSGCIMGLIGENGAGKSTTIKLILDMILSGFEFQAHSSLFLQTEMNHFHNLLFAQIAG